MKNFKNISPSISILDISIDVVKKIDISCNNGIISIKGGIIKIPLADVRIIDTNFHYIILSSNNEIVLHKSNNLITI
jgi:hypothetical protein